MQSHKVFFGDSLLAGLVCTGTHMPIGHGNGMRGPPTQRDGCGLERRARGREGASQCRGLWGPVPTVPAPPHPARPWAGHAPPPCAAPPLTRLPSPTPRTPDHRNNPPPPARRCVLQPVPLRLHLPHLRRRPHARAAAGGEGGAVGLPGCGAGQGQGGLPGWGQGSGPVGGKGHDEYTAPPPPSHHRRLGAYHRPPARCRPSSLAHPSILCPCPRPTSPPPPRCPSRPIRGPRSPATTMGCWSTYCHAW